MSARSVLLTLLLGAVVATLATGCGDPTPSPSSSSPSSAPSSPSGTTPTAGSSTPSPEPSSSPTAAAPTATPLPASCAALVSTADPSQFGSAPLNSSVFVPQGPSGVVTPTTPPDNATARQVLRAIHELWCLWANPSSDVTHLSVEVGHYDVASSTGLMATLQSQGYECSDTLGGRLCSITQPNTQYPVDDNFTYFARDDVMILVDQTNFPTNGLLASMVSVIWP